MRPEPVFGPFWSPTTLFTDMTRAAVTPVDGRAGRRCTQGGVDGWVPWTGGTRSVVSGQGQSQSLDPVRYSTSILRSYTACRGPEAS